MMVLEVDQWEVGWDVVWFGWWGKWRAL